ILILDNHITGYEVPKNYNDIPNVSAYFARGTFRFWVRYGVSSGIMGSLSTVSTWISELYKLSNRKLVLAYRYGVVSILAAMIPCLIIGGIWIGVGKPLHM